jgi:hypothetical protein
VPRKRVQGARAYFKIWAAQLSWVGTETSCGKSWRSKGRLPRMGLAQNNWRNFHFPKLISNAKTIPVKPRNFLKALKILRKSQKFQENSQSYI